MNISYHDEIGMADNKWCNKGTYHWDPFICTSWPVFLQKLLISLEPMNHSLNLLQGVPKKIRQIKCHFTPFLLPPVVNTNSAIEPKCCRDTTQCYGDLWLGVGVKTTQTYDKSVSQIWWHTAFKLPDILNIYSSLQLVNVLYMLWMCTYNEMIRYKC